MNKHFIPVKILQKEYADKLVQGEVFMRALYEFGSWGKLDISNELEKAILSAMENQYIKKSRVLDTKEGSINGLSIMILKERFSEETLIKGMKHIKENIDRDFHTLSYISRIIKSIDK